MKKFLLGLIILLVAVAAATSAIFLFPYNPDNPPIVDDSSSSPEGIAQVVSANNKFAFDLYAQLNSGENLFYSPYSISAALAMVYEGARAQTAEEIKSVFHFPQNEILRPNFASIYNEINSNDKPYQLKTGNALWVQRDFPILEEYTSAVENYYGGKATNLDFIAKTEESRQTINDFIAAQTNDKIKDLIPQGVLDVSTRLVLTNAIYFKGDWVWQFDKSETEEMDFHVTLDKTTQTDMMHMNPEEATFNYFENDEIQMLELPYKGNELSMVIILPREDLENMASSLTLDNYNEWKSKMTETSLDSIFLPKFEMGTKYFMKETLSELGMPTAFSSSADFSGMDGTQDLYLGQVIHQAYVKVDEEGTEAAAATAAVMQLKSIGPEYMKIFRADHPFIFVIQEKSTGNILFMGRLTNPNQ